MNGRKELPSRSFSSCFLHAATVGGRGVCVAQTCTDARSAHKTAHIGTTRPTPRSKRLRRCAFLTYAVVQPSALRSQAALGSGFSLQAAFWYQNAMKKSILQYAIQGKLVEQRPEEGTGKELYRQIQTEKQRLTKEGKIKKEKPLPEIAENEKPYDIPDNWTWVRFGDLGSYKKGPFGSAITKSMFVPKGNGAIKVYEQKNAIQKDATLGDYYIRRDYFESKMKGFEVFPGDIIVSCAGTIGETYVMPDKFEQGIINQALMRMKIFEPLYIPYFLTFFDFVLKKNARSGSKGSAIKNIPPFEILKNYLVPIPPLAEQKRIVAKLEEILPLCERLK